MPKLTDMLVWLFAKLESLFEMLDVMFSSEGD